MNLLAVQSAHLLPQKHLEWLDWRRWQAQRRQWCPQILPGRLLFPHAARDTPAPLLQSRRPCAPGAALGRRRPQGGATAAGPGPARRARAPGSCLFTGKRNLPSEITKSWEGQEGFGGPSPGRWVGKGGDKGLGAPGPEITRGPAASGICGRRGSGAEYKWGNRALPKAPAAFFVSEDGCRAFPLPQRF